MYYYVFMPKINKLMMIIIIIIIIMSTLKMKWKKVQPCSYALTLKQDA